jgi:hypothetical protein
LKQLQGRGAKGRRKRKEGTIESRNGIKRIGVRQRGRERLRDEEWVQENSVSLEGTKRKRKRKKKEKTHL